MVCNKCAVVNDNGDLFCYKCGASLVPVQDNAHHDHNHSHQQTSQPGGEQFKPTTEDRLAISATTTLAAKKARVSDVKSMRPLTQAAYNIVESDRGGVYSTLISLLHIIISLAIVADIIMIFDTINLIVSSTTSSKIEGSLYETAYKNLSNENQMRLIWSMVIFVFLVMAFVCIGRLSIRINKVNRKRRRENLTSRID